MFLFTNSLQAHTLLFSLLRLTADRSDPMRSRHVSAGPGRAVQPPRSTLTHLLCDDHQRVPVLGQEVEDAPDLEGVVVGDAQLASVQVLPGAKRPAHLVEVLTVEVVPHLWQDNSSSESRFQVQRQNVFGQPQRPFDLRQDLISFFLETPF